MWFLYSWLMLWKWNDIHVNVILFVHSFDLFWTVIHKFDDPLADLAFMNGRTDASSTFCFVWLCPALSNTLPLFTHVVFGLVNEALRMFSSMKFFVVFGFVLSDFFELVWLILTLTMIFDFLAAVFFGSTVCISNVLPVKLVLGNDNCDDSELFPFGVDVRNDLDDVVIDRLGSTHEPSPDILMS